MYADSYDNIPQEMRQYRQWILWVMEDKGGKKPTKVPYSPVSGIGHASVTDPSTFGTFDECLNLLRNNPLFQNYGLGFVLTNEDPYTFIDLDDTEGDQNLLNAQKEIYERIGSYTELSPSRNGVHIIVRGSIPSGVKRNSVELYCSSRFMTMTGWFLDGSNPAIVDRNAEVNELHEMLGGEVKAVGNGIDGKETMSDERIIEIALSAENGDKFNVLHSGDWRADYNYDHSAADQAYMNFLAFYTQNRAQMKRMFMASQLGQRAKAQRSDYIEYTINRALDMALPPVDISAMSKKLNEALENRRKEQEQKQTVQRIITEPEPMQLSEPDSVYTPPEGLLGEIAKYIYDQSPRPVAEIALAAAVGLMAGICGRSHNISGTGLNMYIMVLAKTGIGKGAADTGIRTLMREVSKDGQMVSAQLFVGPDKFESSQGLTKHLANTSASFIHVLGEIGIEMKRMCDPRAQSNLQAMRRAWLDLYSRSGCGQMYGGSVYSDKQKNTAAVVSPAYSILGEGTPERFYESLDEDFINEGLISRFLIIEYKGKRKHRREGHQHVKPPEALLMKLKQLCAQSIMANGSGGNVVVDVKMTDEARAIMNDFDHETDNKINSAERDALAELWNRAHLKALKLASLAAVGINIYNPVINATQAKWAIAIVKKDVETIVRRFESGNVGTSTVELKQFDLMRKTIREYFLNGIPATCNSLSPELYNDRIIPYNYLSRALISHAPFRTTGKATWYIKTVLDEMCRMGALVRNPRGTLSEKYGFKGEGFMVDDLDYFNLR